LSKWNYLTYSAGTVKRPKLSGPASIKHLPSFIEQVYNDQRLHKVYGIYLRKNQDEDLANCRPLRINNR
jgi:hypothetical protein